MTRLALALAPLALASSAAVAADGSMGRWADYAADAITPDYAWADRTAAVEPSALDASISRTSDEVVAAEIKLLGTTATVSLNATAPSLFGATESAASRDVAAKLAELRPGVSRSSLSTAVNVDLGQGRLLGAGVVLARQEFASMGLGLTDPVNGLGVGAINETSQGVGVRLDLAAPLSESLGVDLSYRSRINMDSFQRYRGLFSEPGDFDVPSVTAVGLSWTLAPGVRLGLSESRIGYSDVSAFTSRALPQRFTSLLGDGGSPDFRWQNLNVTAMTASFDLSRRDRVDLRYSTSQQPNPTSPLLDQALSNFISQNNWWLSWQHRANRAGTFGLAATYSGQTNFLGNPSYTDRDASGAQVEVEATWSMAF